MTDTPVRATHAPIPGRFEDRVAVVTGSTQGLGETLLHRLADEGLRGAVVTGRNAERGMAVVEALRAKGCEAIFVAADLDDVDALASVGESVKKISKCERGAFRLSRFARILTISMRWRV